MKALAQGTAKIGSLCQRENRRLSLRAGLMRSCSVLVSASLVLLVFVWGGQNLANAHLDNGGAADNSTNQMALAKAALESKSEYVLEVTLARLTNQTALAMLIVEAKDDNIRRAAFVKLNDDEQLAKLAMESHDDAFRLAVNIRLGKESWPSAGDGSGLDSQQLYIVMRALALFPWEVRRNTVASMTHQGLLAKLALEDKDEIVRRAAVRRLSDQVLLAKAALNDKEGSVREMAVASLTDRGLLAKIALEDTDSTVRRAAVSKLSDQAVLGNIALKDKNSSIRRAAVDKLSDQAVLAQIALKDEDLGTCIEAVRKLSDQAFLAQLAVESDKGRVRADAVKKLNDQRCLAKIALKDENLSVRKCAVEKLNDQESLCKVAVADADENVRALAVEKLRQLMAAVVDQDALARTAQEHPVWDIRKFAFGKLTEATLNALAGKTKDPALRLAAEVQLKRQSWDNVFDEVRRRSRRMEDVLGAIALVGHQEGVSPLVVQTCHQYLRQGDSTRISELKELLSLYGDVPLAEDYLNCGQSDLSKAGSGWAARHGYSVGVGNGSHRAIWGSGKVK